MKNAIVVAFIFSWVIVAILGMPSSSESRSSGKMSSRNSESGSPSKGKKSNRNSASGSSSSGSPYLENCDTNADCPELSVCTTPGLGKAAVKAQGKCLFCNCTDSSQCTLEGRIMTCNCTGSGYTGLYCETLIDPCRESDVCVDGVTATTSITASTTPQVITSPDYPNEWYCDGLDLTWQINAPSGKEIEITFTYFVTDISDAVTIVFTNDVGDTRQETIEGNADPNFACIPHDQSLTDKLSMPFLSIPDEIVTIHFSTDNSDTGPGWSATVVCID